MVVKMFVSENENSRLKIKICFFVIVPFGIIVMIKIINTLK